MMPHSSAANLKPLHAAPAMLADMHDLPPTRSAFLAVLEGWAMDCMDLRARGLDRPSPRPGVAGLPTRALSPRAAAEWTTGLRPQSPRWTQA